MKKDGKRKVSAIKNNFYFLKLVWQISPAAVILNFFTTLLGFAQWVFYSVFFLQYLFGAAGERKFTDILIFIWAAAVIDVLISIYNAWFYQSYMYREYIKIGYRLNLKLFKKAQSADISCYETPEFYNIYTEAASEAAARAMSVLNNCSAAVSALISSVTVIVTMAKITPLALIFIALPLIGNLFFGKKLGHVTFEIDRDTTPARRQKDYVNRVLYFHKYAAEIRTTGFFGVLKEAYGLAAKRTVEVARQYALKKSLYSGAKSILMFLLGYEGMWLCAAILGISGKLGVSDLIVLLNAIVSVSWMLNNFERSVSGLFTDAEFIENLKQFFAYKPKIDETAGGLEMPEHVESIEFKNVYFKYDGAENYALENISLVLNRGDRNALVGINGSGKSTFLKLLMRFYDPEKGEILLNGVNIKKYDVNKYRKHIGVAFQDFAMFSATVAENVLLDEVKTAEDRDRVTAALKKSDVYEDILKLKNGMDTVLTREFDENGAELSGGQRQKIAIARAVAKNSDVILLDEPSSALDPIAEYKMFETMAGLCKNKDVLSVIVSHRLSSAAVCEKIFVFDKGKLAEQGTHKKLLENGGVYAEMFKKQAQNYLTEAAHE